MMAEALKSHTNSQVTISTASSEQAPFIYFDGVSCLGQHSGTIQLELVAHVLRPEGGAVMVELIHTAHIRCSPNAAILLRDALDKAIAMVRKDEDPAQPIQVLRN
jgi:hypothetical protein